MSDAAAARRPHMRRQRGVREPTIFRSPHLHPGALWANARAVLFRFKPGIPTEPPGAAPDSALATGRADSSTGKPWIRIPQDAGLAKRVVGLLCPTELP